jgi:hypothetical protein
LFGQAEDEIGNDGKVKSQVQYVRAELVFHTLCVNAQVTMVLNISAKDFGLMQCQNVVFSNPSPVKLITPGWIFKVI